MRHDEIPDDLKRLAFEFFYRFSRFDFALKEAGFLRSKKDGVQADADWHGFIERYSGGYRLTPAAETLVNAKPQRQIVRAGELNFGDVTFEPGTSDLERVVRLVQTVRNNLFHGGKHGSDYWDHPERRRPLLSITIDVLSELANMAGLQGDYERYY